MGKGHGKSSGFIHPYTKVLILVVTDSIFYNDKKKQVYMYECIKSPLQHKHKPPIKRKESLSSQSDITQETTLISHPKLFLIVKMCINIWPQFSMFLEVKFYENFYVI